MLLIIVAMIIGSSLTAFSLPAASASGSGLAGLRISPVKTGDAPFTAPSATPPSALNASQALQRGSLLNLSV